MSEDQVADVRFLRNLLFDNPQGLKALQRLRVQYVHLALALKATATLLKVQGQLTPKQMAVTAQVLRATTAPALALATQVAEQVAQEQMLDRGLNPESPADWKQFADQMGKSIIISK